MFVIYLPYLLTLFARCLRNLKLNLWQLLKYVFVLREQMVIGHFDTLILKNLSEHYTTSNMGVVRYFVKRIMANLIKPTSINAIYKDIKSQGLKVSKDYLYLWADYFCNIFMFVRIPKYDHSLIKEQKSLNKYYCIEMVCAVPCLCLRVTIMEKIWKTMCSCS